MAAWQLPGVQPHDTEQDEELVPLNTSLIPASLASAFGLPLPRQSAPRPRLYPDQATAQPSCSQRVTGDRMTLSGPVTQGYTQDGPSVNHAQPTQHTRDGSAAHPSTISQDRPATSGPDRPAQPSALQGLSQSLSQQPTISDPASCRNTSGSLTSPEATAAANMFMQAAAAAQYIQQFNQNFPQFSQQQIGLGYIPCFMGTGQIGGMGGLDMAAQQQLYRQLASAQQSQGTAQSVGGANEGAGDDEDAAARAVKRPRLVWTPKLHKCFEEAIARLGDDKAVPKTIMQEMKVDGLTRENVASHLQKWRLQKGVVTVRSDPTNAALAGVPLISLIQGSDSADAVPLPATAAAASQGPAATQ